MTREERKKEIRDVIESLSVAEDVVIDAMHKLGEFHCKREAAKLDTICAKLYNAVHDLHERTRRT